MNFTNFEARLADDRKTIEALAVKVLSKDGDVLHQAMRYALIGGKMIRGFLVLEGARLHGVPRHQAQYAALAIECVHAYSLIHDDLPCMDDDDLRRGQPTLHRKWDEATAVLAGDALLTLAFELISNDAVGEARVNLIHTLAIAAGRDGMVAGQMMDIAAETAPAPLTLDEITRLQASKTGALLLWAAVAGATLAGADTEPLETYGKRIGLAFQIADDVLDVEGDTETVGKATGKDNDAGKATFVTLLGLPEAKSLAKSLVHEACEALSVYRGAGETLRQAAHFIVARQK